MGTRTGAGTLDLTGGASSWHEAVQPHRSILICLLGGFRIESTGRLTMRSGGKGALLMSALALGSDFGVGREVLLDTLWPGGDRALAGQSLNSLIYALHRTLAVAIDDAPPILRDNGRYRLNREAGIDLDIRQFSAFVNEGDRHARAGVAVLAAEAYRSALALYRGDLAVGLDVHAVVERERLRAQYLKLLAWLADHAFSSVDYETTLDYALRLLAHDPCREDAHRLVMRSHVRRGERSQALHQYRLCEQILRAEFGAVPEPTTVALFEQLRTDPSGV